MERRSPSRWMKAFAGAGIAAVAIAGCQPGATGSSGTGQTPQKDMVLRYPIGSIKTLDPGLATDSVSNDIVTKLFEALTDVDDSGTIKPLGAASWTWNASATVVTFKLNPNAKWSDGKPVTAQDYEYAIKRVLNPATASEYANTIDLIKNGKDIIAKKAAPETAGVRAVDATTLEITLENAAPYFLAIASTWTMSPVRKDVVDKFGNRWTDAENIVTNGPFKLTKWVKDQSLTLARNDEYFGAKPQLTRVDVRVFPDGPDQENAILRAYEADELDTTGTYPIPSSEVVRITGGTMASQVKVFAQSRTEWVCVNHAKKPFDDVRVRQALGLSLERQRLIDQVLRIPAVPMFGLIPEGIGGRNPSAWMKEDLNQAKALLAQAGYPNGAGFPEMTVNYNTSAQNKTYYEYLAGRWKEALGITVKLEPMDFPVLISFRRGNRTYDAFRCSWGSDYEDPFNWHNTLFTSTADPQQQTTNWRNADYDRLVEAAGKNPDAAARAKQYSDAEALMAKDQFVIPVFSSSRRVLVKNSVKNYTVRRIAGGSVLTAVTVG